jgi:hypothetical protein
LREARRLSRADGFPLRDRSQNIHEHLGIESARQKSAWARERQCRFGTGDGIVQTGPQDTANKLRTEPLWGLRMRPRFMHDLRSLTLHNAIERHEGEAEHVVRGFQRLTETEKQQLLNFLETL